MKKEYIDFIKDGEIGFITTENGRIIQLGMAKEMHAIITQFIAVYSKENPLVKMGEEYDLVLKSTVKTVKP